MTRQVSRRHIERNYSHLMQCFCFLAVCLVAVILPVRSVNAATQMYFVHNDHLGTPVKLTDGSQGVVWEADKKPFGETSTSGSIGEDSRFPGQYFDAESGTSYNYFRDYDPSLGRYIQSDPIGTLQDYSDPQRQVAASLGIVIPATNSLTWDNNLYGYSRQTPIVLSDSTGEFAPLVTAAIGVAFDVAGQLVANGGNWRCVDLVEAAVAGGTALVFPGGLAVAQHARTVGRQGLSGLAAGFGAGAFTRFSYGYSPAETDGPSGRISIRVGDLIPGEGCSCD